MRKKKKEITPSQGTLSGKTIEIEEIIETKESEVAEIEEELELISHTEICDICLVECGLDVLRHGGTRTFWFLNYLCEEYDDWDDKCGDVECETFERIPRAIRYDLGFYPNENNEEARLFVLDRLAWAKGWLNNKKERLLKEIEEIEEVNIYANRKI